MNNSIVTLSTVLLISSTSLAVKGKNLPEDFRPQQSKAITFTENKGQVYDQNNKSRPDVLYGTMAGNLAVHIKKTGVSYQLYRVDEWKEIEDPHTEEKRKEIEKQTIYRIDLNWLNANNNIIKTEDEVLPGYNNYYLESCPNGALSVKSYKGITLHKLYRGIDLHYYEKQGELKHDYIVAPHADYKQIQIEVIGAEVKVNTDGSLILKTPLGEVQEGRPIVFQQGRELKANWQLENNVLSFNVENVNPNYELIIDPVTRLWGTFYGGSGNDVGLSCSSDAIGNVHLAGYTPSNTGTVIATTGAHQTTYGGGSVDAFLVKFNASGVRQWGSYYGGAGADYGRSCSTDASGNVYLAGYTTSNTGTVIATTGAHQATYGGGLNDAFIVKFDAAGVRQWGSYYGGASDDPAWSCNTDASGNVYIAGGTQSSSGTVIATTGAHQTTYGGSTGDAYIVKFNSSGVRQWGSYYGGASYDVGYSCSIDASGNVFLAGRSDSNTGNNIATASSHQSNHGGGIADAFLVKFNASGVRQWGSYYGGASNDEANSCSADASGNVYLVGYTQSNTSTVIATTGAHQTTFGGGADDAFIVKFDAAGVRQWGSYYGGSTSDLGYSCSADASGNIYLAGRSDSNTGTFIATVGAYQSAYGGSNDAYLVKFNNSGVRQWGSYYGGASGEWGYSCSTDALGNVYIGGHTGSTGTVIASAGAHQSSIGGSFDAFLVKLTDCVALSPSASVNASVCAGTGINFTVGITGTATPVYNWTGPSSFSSNVQNSIIANASTVHIGVYTVTVNNAGCIETATTQVNTVYTTPTVSVNNGTICSGNSFTIVPSGSITYTIQGGNFVVSPNTSTNYTVTGSSSEGCLSANTATSSIVVNSLPAITVTATSLTICLGESIVLMASGATSYTWSPIALGSSVMVSPNITTVYSVTGQDASGCENTATFTLNVDACTGLSEYTKSTGIKLYPNPNNGLLYVELPFDATLTILNKLGQIVYNSKYNSGQLQMNLEHLAAGVYVLRVQHDGSIQNFNVIKR
jgi:hypothetical protein